MKYQVSILMPVYNGEKYLREAIDSVLAQTFKDFEFLILNDGSTDGTQNIIDSYSDKRIKSVYHKNMGVAKSLNRGLELAQGEYIWRHDADDICLPEQLKTQLDFLEKNKGFALVSTQIAFMTDRGKIAHSYKQPKDSYFDNHDFIKVNRSQFNPYSPITHATVLLKKEVFDTVGVYRTAFKTSEDTDLWLRIIEKFDAAVLNYCSYFVRLNATSATQVYKSTNNFYRDMAFQFADERLKFGEDSLQLGKEMPKPNIEKNIKITPSKKPFGKTFRSDLLSFMYKVALNAKDYKNVITIIKISIKDGWRLSQTWKAIIFPLLGEKLVSEGVRLKQKVQ
ncbi:glycosyltransferase family 2 protein [Psychroserpens sp. Hel_I_66]|uniref:glycosyltransferase family 2 protein n=1 Tax=Psychroserpens sp. Hel_I_66 TaxID=1250004 RepID=UPI000691ABC5|nr:glycosyltransferase family 2 protein [Psychroserpens sp. Hel_I_66]